MQEQPAYNQKKRTSSVITLERGKIPPQAVDLEEIVLGSILIDRNGMDEVADILHADIFYKDSHKKIFEAMEVIYSRDEAIDLMTLSQQLIKFENLESVGGNYFLVELTQKVSSSAHIVYHSKILIQKYVQRQLIRNSSAIIENAYDATCDPLELLDEAYNHLNSTAEVLVTNKANDIEDITSAIILEGGRLFRNEIIPGIETPIAELTDKMGGWRDGELIIIAARPGMGKTAFALLCAWNAALNGMAVAFFSLEMSANKLMQRIWSMECRIEGDKFNKIGLSPDDQRAIAARSSEIGKVGFHIEDESNLTIQRLRVKAKRLKKEHGIRMIVLDYLQLMSGNSKNREQEISEISRGLKLLATELKIPVIALSQLSRSVETRGGNKRPLLSDLRESGAIEQDADVVQFLYRPEYYNHTEWDDYDKAPCRGEAEFIVAKNRNGGLVRNRMKFEGKYTLFSDLGDDQDFEYPPMKPALLTEAFETNNKLDPFQDTEEDDLPF